MENNNINYFFICIQYLYLYCIMEQKWKKILMNKCQKLKKHLMANKSTGGIIKIVFLICDK